MHCCVDPPFFLSFVTALLNTGYFSVPPSLFKLSHGHPVLHCLLRHCFNDNWMSTFTKCPFIPSCLCVYSKYCQETRLARIHSRLYAQNRLLAVWLILTERHCCLISLSQSDNVIFHWGKRQIGYLHRTKYNWFVRVIN